MQNKQNIFIIERLFESRLLFSAGRASLLAHACSGELGVFSACCSVEPFTENDNFLNDSNTCPDQGTPIVTDYLNYLVIWRKIQLCSKRISPEAEHIEQSVEHRCASQQTLHMICRDEESPCLNKCL